MIYLLILFCALEKQYQTDWMGGSGVQGPVTSWSTRYYQSDSVTAATNGQVSLVATQWNYTNWIKHIIESNAGIPTYTQGLMPADIDKDGIVDVVGHSNDSVAWYKNDGNYNFTKNVIGPSSDGGQVAPCTFPCDLDKDGDIDVLSGTVGSAIRWFQNNLPGPWVSFQIDTGQYHRISAEDIDLDGDMDVIAADNSDWFGGDACYGSIRIYKNNGAQVFSLFQTIDPSVFYSDGWRAYTVDFNKDGYPDLYSVCYDVYVYLNDGPSNPGHFTQCFASNVWSGMDFDGAWPSDINMDGNMDLVCASGVGGNYAFYGLLGDGMGNFNDTALTVGGLSAYCDGSITADMDLDGLPDIIGTSGKVGYMRQSPAWTFTDYRIDSLWSASHWAYVSPIKHCTPSIDLLITRSGEHLIYENKMLERFANPGYLTSSILELADTLRRLKYFGWEACVPGDSTLAFWWRADSTAGSINGQSWNGPYYASNDTDSIFLPPAPCERYFQYRVGLWPKATPVDIAVLYGVWVSYDTCMASGFEEAEAVKKLSLKVMGDRILVSPGMKISKVELCVYNATGELVEVIYKGPLENRDYIFKPRLKARGVYLAALKYSGKIETIKLVKSK